MRLFKNILVGVDVSRGEHFVADRLPGHTERAWQTALRLAKLNSSRLTFLHVMQLSAETQHLIQRDTGFKRTVIDLAKERLRDLVDRAVREGVVAQSRLVLGKCWVETVRQVYRDQHDLAIVGTRQFGTFKSLLLSTGAKLLRKCPCAVLIAKPGSATMFSSILTAHDFTKVGKTATKVALSISKQHDSRLHVLQPFGFSLGSGATSPGSPPRVNVIDRIEETLWLEQHIARAALNTQPLIHSAKSSSYCNEVIASIERHKIGLAVLGTEACTGFTWMFRRNIAERLASGIPCSLLVVKPAEMMSSVSMEEAIEVTDYAQETRDQLGA
jgi:universal stress protein E